MTRLRQRLSFAFLLTTLLGGVAGHRISNRLTEQLVAERTRIEQLTAEIALARTQLENTQRQLAAIERDTAVTRADIVALESSPPWLWSARVKLLKQLLDEMPAQKIPELALLTPLDWLHVARTAELDTANRIRTAFAALRTLARRNLVKPLQEALRAFAAASSGELPADIRQLAPYLPLPATPTMLERYTMLRTGRLEASDDYLVAEKPGFDAVLKVGLKRHGITTSSDLQDAPGSTDTEKAERVFGAFDPAFDAEIGTRLAPVVQEVGKLADAYTPLLADAFGEEVGVVFKAAGRRFLAERPNEKLTNLAQLYPYFPDPEKFLAVIRPAFAQLEYFALHGKPPADPAALQPFLARPFDPATALRPIRISFEGEKMTWSYSVTTEEVAVDVSTSSAP